MSSDPEGKYTVDRVPEVNKQIRELARKAKAKDSLKKYLNALESTLQKLERDPLGWGDPEYHPQSEGSTVCHGISGPLYVRFVVFDAEGVVIILQLRAMPNSILE
jgi:hypothetical protein